MVPLNGIALPLVVGVDLLIVGIDDDHAPDLLGEIDILVPLDPIDLAVVIDLVMIRIGEIVDNNDVHFPSLARGSGRQYIYFVNFLILTSLTEP